MKVRYLIPTVLLAGLVLAGCNVNKNINIPDHAHVSGSSTVNGEISVGTGAVVDGGLRTINGRINVAAGAQTGSLTSINGNITLAHGVHAGDLKTVNGDFTLGKDTLTANLASVNGDIHAANGAHIAGDVGNVNGDMALCGAQLDGNLRFYNGSVLITAGGVVHGNVTAKKPTHDYQESQNMNEPVVIIGPHATIDGAIAFERPGKLYVSDSAVIHTIEGATTVKYSGPAPAGVRLPVCPAN
ncbi:MAG TPA: hypothetical protein VNF46_07395 [Gammaproteobacteria bacterium]|nr:hypothetical protein [Gammaproteobacteria bacterium]